MVGDFIGNMFIRFQMWNGQSLGWGLHQWMHDCFWIWDVYPWCGTLLDCLLHIDCWMFVLLFWEGLLGVGELLYNLTHPCLGWYNLGVAGLVVLLVLLSLILLFLIGILQLCIGDGHSVLVVTGLFFILGIGCIAMIVVILHRLLALVVLSSESSVYSELCGKYHPRCGIAWCWRSIYPQSWLILSIFIHSLIHVHFAFILPCNSHIKD